MPLGVNKYKYGSDCKYPNGIFDYAKSIFDSFDVPNLSVDIAYDGKNFYLLEFFLLLEMIRLGQF